MKDRKITYVTGISGVGKSTLVREFTKQKLVAIDVDTFSHWEHSESGERNSWKPGASREFLDTHRWVCDHEALQKFFKEHNDQDIYVFGVIDNEKDIFPLFDKMILLECSTEVAFKRIDAREDNDFGKGDTEKEWIKDWKDDFEKDMLALGAIPVSAEDPVEAVMGNILTVCK